MSEELPQEPILDAFGNEIKVGHRVAYSRTHTLYTGVVKELGKASGDAYGVAVEVDLTHSGHNGLIRRHNPLHGRKHQLLNYQLVVMGMGVPE